MVGLIPCNAGNSTEGLCNTVRGSNQLGSNSVEFTDYGYIVAAWSAYLFTILFVIVTVWHIFVGAWKRHWWVIGTLAFGAAVEAIGWGGRIMSVQGRKWNENLGGFWEYDHNSFIIQVVCLVIAPTLFSAANYIILGKLINATGGVYSILTPRSFAIWFMFADFVCLVIQGVGGGLAGTADTPQGADNGAYIMTGGVVVQLVVTVAFVVVLIDFVRRYRSQRPALKQYHPLPNRSFMRRPASRMSTDLPLNQYPSGQSTPGVKSETRYGFAPNGQEQDIPRRSVWIMVTMLAFTTLLIVIRSVFRSVELTDGWSGPIATNQALFLGMDAFLMALLIWAYAIFHPAFFLPRLKL